MSWTGEHRAFIVEDFFKNGESYIAAVRNFKNRYTPRRHDQVPTLVTLHADKIMSVMLWVNNFRATGSALKRKPPGRPLCVRTPESSRVMENCENRL